VSITISSALVQSKNYVWFEILQQCETIGARKLAWKTLFLAFVEAIDNGMINSKWASRRFSSNRGDTKAINGNDRHLESRYTDVSDRQLPWISILADRYANAVSSTDSV